MVRWRPRHRPQAPAWPPAQGSRRLAPRSCGRWSDAAIVRPVNSLRVLLPPSEGKAAGGDGSRYDPRIGGFAGLSSPRERVRKALRHRDFDAASQLGVKGVALAAAIKTNRSIAAAD